TRSLFLENTEYAIFDLSREDQVELALFAPTMAGRIVYGRTPLDLIESYTAYAGRMRPLPDWVHEGVIVGVMGGTATALQKIDTPARADVPVAAFWVQDWVGQRQTSVGTQLWWNWQLDETLYPDWDAMVKTLADRLSARMLIYVNPFLTDASGHDQLFR